ncbi:MAG: site-2 protease family protein, partial [Synergistes sp.]|nr:site-2 protease family protein [Synergistes sp.]
MLSIVSFLIVIAICVISHEGGHFIAAKLRNVMVHEFSFGMGPEIVSTKKGETQYSLRAFPIGGFVKLEGEDVKDSGEETHCAPGRSLLNKKPWERAFIIAAGASVNILLAWLITAFYLAGCGVYNMDTPTIGKIMDNTPAFAAGLKSGDIIKSIDGNELKSWSDIRKNIMNEKKKSDLYEIVIERGGSLEKYSLNIPVNTETGSRLLGVQPQLVKFPPLKALSRSFRYSWDMSVQILKGLYMTITGRIKADVTGPVGIASM